jgi:hypothetical protein
VVKAKIEIEEIEGSIKVTGTADNLSEIVQSLSYKLSVIKKKNNINNLIMPKKDYFLYNEVK